MRSPDVLSAVGIGVSDLERSAGFYVDVLGMRVVHTYNLEHIDELILDYDGRSNALLLMHYKDGRAHHYKDNPVKLVFSVADAVSICESARAKGAVVLQEATPQEIVGGATVGLFTDPDGYRIEVIQPIAKLDALGTGRAE